MLSSKLSSEVRLLFQMTKVDCFYGFPKSVSVVQVSDFFNEKEIQGDVSVVLAKMICYEQIIENMTVSLYRQDKLWRKVNGYKPAPRIEKHYDILELMKHFMDFDRKDEMRERCHIFRKRRNNLAHNILKRSMDDWVNDYCDVDKWYEEIVSIYFEQESAFCNRIAEKLLNPELYLIKDKDYTNDIDVIERRLSRIVDEEERIMCIQMINVLRAFMDDCECPELRMKLFLF